MHHFYRGEWEQARNAAHSLVETTPDHKMGRLLLIDLLMRLEDVDGAERALSDVRDQIDPSRHESLLRSIRVRRVIRDRRQVSC